MGRSVRAGLLLGRRRSPCRSRPRSPAAARRPCSPWRCGSSGFSTLMSEEISRSPALISFGPLAWKMPRRGPSPRCLKRICFRFRTMSVTSSCTPGIVANSCRTRSSWTRIAVTATPCSDESSTRRSALPSVVPKPRSSGSTTNRAYRRLETASSDEDPLRHLEGFPLHALDPPGWPAPSAARLRSRGRAVLLRVELDDQLLLERHRDLLPRRNLEQPPGHGLLVELEPLLHLGAPAILHRVLDDTAAPGSSRATATTSPGPQPKLGMSTLRPLTWMWPWRTSCRARVPRRGDARAGRSRCPGASRAAGAGSRR